jgi:hypothetical protein
MALMPSRLYRLTYFISDKGGVHGRILTGMESTRRHGIDAQD